VITDELTVIKTSRHTSRRRPLQQAALLHSYKLQIITKQRIFAGESVFDDMSI